jgi:sterol 24-C-methyltransferase
MSNMAIPLVYVGRYNPINSSATFSFFEFSIHMVVVASQVLDVGCGIGGPLREIARFRY